MVAVAVIAVPALVFLYKTNNPAGNAYFPQCPFRVLTGLQCPGCGSQRAVHHLLNFEVLHAARENALLVLSIPYIFTGLAFGLIRRPDEKLLQWRRIFFGHKAIYVILFIIAAFWIGRNLSSL